MARAITSTDRGLASERECVLTAATIRAADHLGIGAPTLAAILGVSQPTVSRMKSGTYLLAERSKPFELAQLLLRLFSSLDSIVGSDDAAARSWLITHNSTLQGRPIDLVTKARGLVETVMYLDARRAVV
jgi:Protein of unknown function (DUF2384)